MIKWSLRSQASSTHWVCNRPQFGLDCKKNWRCSIVLMTKPRYGNAFGITGPLWELLHKGQIMRLLVISFISDLTNCRATIPLAGDLRYDTHETSLGWLTWSLLPPPTLCIMALTWRCLSANNFIVFREKLWCHRLKGLYPLKTFWYNLVFLSNCLNRRQCFMRWTHN